MQYYFIQNYSILTQTTITFFEHKIYKNPLKISLPTSHKFM